MYFIENHSNDATAGIIAAATDNEEDALSAPVSAAVKVGVAVVSPPDAGRAAQSDVGELPVSSAAASAHPSARGGGGGRGGKRGPKPGGVGGGSTKRSSMASTSSSSTSSAGHTGENTVGTDDSRSKELGLASSNQAPVVQQLKTQDDSHYRAVLLLALLRTRAFGLGVTLTKIRTAAVAHLRIDLATAKTRARIQHRAGMWPL